MVAIPRPTSLIETVFQWRAARRKAREVAGRAAGRATKTGPGLTARFFVVAAESFLTIAMCAGLAVAAFLWLLPVGIAVAALCLPVVEFKVSWSRQQLAQRLVEAEKKARRS